VFLNDFERLKPMRTDLLYRKTAGNGITKSKQLKCIFDVKFHVICIKISFTNLKDAISSKIYINFYHSGVIIIVCIFKFIPVPIPRSTDNPS
jgi:hypothetical protein